MPKTLFNVLIITLSMCAVALAGFNAGAKYGLQKRISCLQSLMELNDAVELFLLKRQPHDAE